MEYDMLFDRDIVFHQAKNNQTYNAWVKGQGAFKFEEKPNQSAESASERNAIR